MLADLGELRARAALERALTIREPQLGPDHPHVAHSLNNLGPVLRGLGELCAARFILERVLAIWRPSSAPTTPTPPLAWTTSGTCCTTWASSPPPRPP